MMIKFIFVILQILCFYRVNSVISEKDLSILSTGQCFQNQIPCKEGCIRKGSKCDQYQDCSDGSDEKGCGWVETCPEGHFRCRYTPLAGADCLPRIYVCDGIKDCLDGSDETDCPGEIDVINSNKSIPDQACYKKMDIVPVLVNRWKPGMSRKWRIVGGSISYMGAWPWLVSLRATGSHKCGASIINNWWILTAAHCFPLVSVGEDPNGWTVVAGEYNSLIKNDRSSEQWMEVEKIITHKKFSLFKRDYDIALMRLKHPLQYNKYTQPACLPSYDIVKKEASTYDKIYCHVSGWGNVKDTFGKGIQKEVKLPIMSPKKCNTSSYHENQILDHMFCAGYDKGVHDSCSGDSGGPLLCPTDKEGNSWEQHGIVSWGGDCAAPMQPGVYTYLYKLLPWVYKNMREYESSRNKTQDLKF